MGLAQHHIKNGPGARSLTAGDESMKEQIAMVLRYVNTDGFVRERFYGIVHVVDIVALTLKKEIYYLFSNHCLDIQNIWG